jgi:hypothetical protein
VQNIGGAPGAYVLWEIIDSSAAIVANGYWSVELNQYAIVTAAAPAWANVPGVFVLNVYQPWDSFVPVQSAAVVCSASATATPTNTATLAPEATNEITPTYTPTNEANE